MEVVEALESQEAGIPVADNQQKEVKQKGSKPAGTEKQITLEKMKAILANCPFKYAASDKDNRKKCWNAAFNSLVDAQIIKERTTTDLKSYKAFVINKIQDFKMSFEAKGSGDEPIPIETEEQRLLKDLYDLKEAE